MPFEDYKLTLLQDKIGLNKLPFRPPLRFGSVFCSLSSRCRPPVYCSLVDNHRFQIRSSISLVATLSFSISASAFALSTYLLASLFFNFVGSSVV